MGERVEGGDRQWKRVGHMGGGGGGGGERENLPWWGVIFARATVSQPWRFPRASAIVVAFVLPLLACFCTVLGGMGWGCELVLLQQGRHLLGFHDLVHVPWFLLMSMYVSLYCCLSWDHLFSFLSISCITPKNSNSQRYTSREAWTPRLAMSSWFGTTPVSQGWRKWDANYCYVWSAAIFSHEGGCHFESVWPNLRSRRFKERN